MNNKKSGPIERILAVTMKVEAHEVRATVLSFLFVFTLMAAYFIVRSARDAMSSDWTRTETSFLWSLTFLFSLVAVVIYGSVISRVRFSRVVPGVYIFFAISFAAFYFASGVAADPTFVDKSFYVWLSVFSLFHVSVFWSCMSGLFTKEQAQRLFAIIASGASIGAIVGPAIPALFAQEIGVMNLMLISAVMLLIPVPMIGALEKIKNGELGNAHLKPDLRQAERLGKNPFSGFLLFVKNPYLLAIGIFILMYVTMSTFVYMELREFLAVYERAARTVIYARIDFVINSLSVLTAWFVTNRMVGRMGMSATLALIPICMVGGWLVVALVPVLSVLIGLQIARRAGNYAITRPCREMLFTVVDTETRFKAKPVIDINVYRGGDMATAWLHTGLREVFNFGLGGVALVAAVIAGIWAMAGVYLGKAYIRKGTGDE